ncbi:hypothetical protein PP357_gp29 [Arthrobacter phage Sarge]|uniref:Uncharacterized protein n=1 Tax=Arthrobacter phage Sarge TaxID=2885974 RepID=A0AAE9C2J9_9CAUD|nr:hypothetical protein PP357_gp29 [Arthrobacter phage Sarge]UDL14876.1 hypothetical protein SEA_SARGE_29 [Arthrobacter phage Sarge]
MGQAKDRTEAAKRYEEARDWLAILIDNPDKTVSVDDYRGQIKSAQRSVAAAYKALAATRG